ncbi:DUF4382 domain-containing protein [Geomonas terrae]|uniref:DUF4382 domain-containing protein n=1 Tax=Geomonas terrae TaxID=2562681 RepID=A0A4S1CEF9_9BACT|nr:DUF4382 domain-containing protein [Geomonas terrae]TGU71643.1 DUF4382 domain-containing protein [Geomonas terrae]
MRKIFVSYRYLLIALCTVTAALLYLGGCGGGGSSSTSKGTLKLAITDRQSEEFQNLFISIREIRLVPAGHENAADNDPALPVFASYTTARSVDVMQLRFSQETLGDLTLPAGTYSQIRLILDPNPGGNQDPVNYLVLASDPNTKIPLTTPSGQQSGLKILGPIEVKPGVINAVMIDFDPNTAVVKRGNSGQYNFKPTGIRLIQMQEMLESFGSIAGNVSNPSVNWSSATVSVKHRGTTNDINPIAAGQIFATYTSGKWQAPFSAFVPASTSETDRYKAFISANGFALYSSAAVSVTAGHETSLGEITLTPNQ